MRKNLLVIVLVGVLHACAVGKLISLKPSDPNDPVDAAFDSLTTALFDRGQPAVNEAVSKLPPEAQALVQAAYEALEQAIKKVEVKGLQPMAAPEHDAAVTVTQDLANIADILHSTIHDPNTTPPLQNP